MNPKCVAIALGVGAAGAANAGIEYTTINDPQGAEQSHAEILGEIFGGVFMFDGDVDLTNGVVTANRLADSGAPGIVDLAGGDSDGPDDRIWGDGDGIVISLEAKFAGDQATFGWIDGSVGGVYVPLIATNMVGDTIEVSLSPEFRWALDDESFGNLVTSNPDDQSLFDAPVDHMVAYHVTGLDDGLNTFVLFFEDRIGGDYDFNDAVVTVSVVPAPGALALLGLGAMAGLRRRR
jgi:hypothetical protein